MSVSLVVPFRALPHTERVRPSLRDGAHRSVLWDWCARRWECQLPEVEIVTGSSDGEELNRSEARNNAFARATGDILVVADADTAAADGQIQAAIDVVTSGEAEWVIAYTDYYMLDGPDTRRLVASDPCEPLVVPERPKWSSDQGNAGLSVMTRSAWEAVGGYDEMYERWGWEDWAFANALETLVHPQVRVPGFVLALRHPRPRDTSKKQGRARMEQYDAAMGDPVAMQALVDESVAYRLSRQGLE